MVCQSAGAGAAAHVVVVEGDVSHVQGKVLCFGRLFIGNCRRIDFTYQRCFCNEIVYCRVIILFFKTMCTVLKLFQYKKNY